MLHVRVKPYYSWLSASRRLSTSKYEAIIVGGGPTGLTTSLLLSNYGIKHAIVEKRIQPTHHPQAHFINMRSMELFRVHLPRVHQRVIDMASESKNWRSFTYCYSIIGRHYAHYDHFEDLKNRSLLCFDSPTNVIHLPQSSFESILREELTNTTSTCTPYFNTQAVSISSINNRSQSHQINCRHANGSIQVLTSDYIIGADGAHSVVRKELGISMRGKRGLQTLLNVYFRCPGFYKVFRDRPSMLYFVFNESFVGVFVAHQPQEDVWVCQIPIFPPHQCLEDYSHDRLRGMIEAGLGIKNRSDFPIEIISTGIWTMNAEVADVFCNGSIDMFLVGDAAHTFPPAGGFGMNSGLQDAHNLAWKLALVLHRRAGKRLLGSYDDERRKIAKENTSLSMKNYQKTAKAAALLGVDPQLAQLAVSMSSSGMIPFPKQAFNAAVSLGMMSLKSLGAPASTLGDYRVNQLRAFVEDEHDSLSLLFPKEDLYFDYHDTNNLHVYDATAIIAGRRIPHAWLRISSKDHDIDDCNSGIISTLDLPELRSTSSQPVIVIIASHQHIEAWIECLASMEHSGSPSLFMLVGMRPSTHTSTRLSHDDMQSRLQLPRYDASEPDRKVVSSTSSSKVAPTIINTSPSSYKVVYAEDVCNRIWQHHDDHASHHCVILRPDGHVAKIFTNEAISEQIQSICTYFHIY